MNMRYLLLAPLLGLVPFSVAHTNDGADAVSNTIGMLTAEKGVTIVAETGSLPIDNSYSYFEGDRIVTDQDGVAGLRLGLDGGMYVGRNSDARVTVPDGLYTIELFSGNTGFTFREGVAYQVILDGFAVRPLEKSTESSGLVAMDVGGEISVRAEIGSLIVTTDTGETSVVKPGEQLAYNSSNSGGLVNVAVTESAASNTVPLIVGGVVVVAASETLSDDTTSPSSGTTTPPSSTVVTPADDDEEASVSR